MRAFLQRTRSLVLLAVLALVAAACGTTSSPSPADASPASPSAVASSPAASDPGPSGEPSTSPSAGAGGPDLGDAASGLEDLTAYQLDMEVAGLVPNSAAGTVTMQATIDTEDDALQFALTGAAGLPTGGDSLRVIVIGDQAWVDPGTGTYVAQPGGASIYAPMFDQLAPASLLQQVPAAGLAGAQNLGTDQKNGIATNHYLAEGSTSPELAAGLGADAVVHFWTATDGGFLVSLDVQGTTDVEGTATAIAMKMDISRINDPTIDIQPPS